MKKIINHYIIIILLLLLPIWSKAQCWELIWSEEFDYVGFPNPDIWTFETGGGGWGNNELQFYRAEQKENAWVEDGKLTITAINESHGGRNYTSARIITRDKYSVQYGKIEARMKLPYGKGIWPAFWAMGQDYGRVGWPACGEIDIMEMVGGTNGDNTVHGVVHWDNNGSHAYYGGNYRLPTGIFADNYHTVSIIWNQNHIRWFVDDIQFHVVDIRPANLSEFHQDFFLLLNLAVGGNWPGSPDASTVFPQTFEIDYIRVYKNVADIQAIPVSGDEVIPAKATGKEYTLPYSSNWTYNWTVPEDAVIESGQSTEKITVTWGCVEGEIQCEVIGECGTYQFTKSIGLQSQIYGPMFISENEENVLIYTDARSETSLEWILPDDATIMSGQGSDSIWVNWGSTFENIVLKTNNTCGENETTFSVIKTGQYPYPDIYSPHAIPGVIEAVNYDYGGPGVAYHDTTTGNTGDGPRQDSNVDTQYSDNGSPNVGWIIAGEWLEYTVKVDSASHYAVEMRVATANANGGPFSILFNGEPLLTGNTVTNTGGWGTFTTKKLGTIYLTEEDTLMRVHFIGGGFNIGKITFTPTADPTNVVNNFFPQEIEIFPVPAKESVTIKSTESISGIVLLDLNGRVLKRHNAKLSTSVVLDLANFRNGMYLLQIESGDGSIGYKRIMKVD